MARGRDISFSLPASALSSMANLCCSTSSICVPHFAEKGLAVWRDYLLEAFVGVAGISEYSLKSGRRKPQPKRRASTRVSQPQTTDLRIKPPWGPAVSLHRHRL